MLVCLKVYSLIQGACQEKPAALHKGESTTLKDVFDTWPYDEELRSLLDAGSASIWGTEREWMFAAAYQLTNSTSATFMKEGKYHVKTILLQWTGHV